MTSEYSITLLSVNGWLKIKIGDAVGSIFLGSLTVYRKEILTALRGVHPDIAYFLQQDPPFIIDDKNTQWLTLLINSQEILREHSLVPFFQSLVSEISNSEQSDFFISDVNQRICGWLRDYPEMAINRQIVEEMSKNPEAFTKQLATYSILKYFPETDDTRYWMNSSNFTNWEFQITL